jgi:predicted DNA-binding transcriptional regulator AlpA
MPGEHLSPAELAAREGVSVWTVYDWNYTGAGPAYFRTGTSPGGRVRYRLADIERWERERMVQRGEQEAARGA